MFGFKQARENDNLINLKIEIKLLRSEITNLHGIMKDTLKATEKNRKSIEAGTTTVEVVKEVNIARKKPRKRLRTATGWKKVTEEDTQEFLKLFDQGLSFTEIASTTGRSGSIISKKIRPFIEAREAETPKKTVKK